MAKQYTVFMPTKKLIYALYFNMRTVKSLLILIFTCNLIWDFLFKGIGQLGEDSRFVVMLTNALMLAQHIE